MKNPVLLFSVLVCIGASAFAQPVPPPAPASSAQPAPVPVPAAPATVGPEVDEQVSAALADYKQKSYGKAANVFEDVAAQLRQMKSKALAQFLPAPPKGWTAKQDMEGRFGINIPGNGSEASRVYTSGGEEVTLKITTDSRIMAAIRNLHTPSTELQFLGHKYAFKPGDTRLPEMVRQNEGNLFVNDNLTITASGKTLTDEQAQGFIGLIDLDKLQVEAEK